MTRENSFSDSDGRSLTPELEEDPSYIGPSSPVIERRTQPTSPVTSAPAPDPVPVIQTPTPKPAVNGITFTKMDPPERADTVSSPTAQRPALMPGQASQRFRDSVRKIIHMKRGSTAISSIGMGAEPGVDPRRSSAHINYGHIKANCVIEVVDYSSVRSSFGRMENKGFIDYLNDPQASKREPWVRVRWVNIGGISWDVISTLAMKYEMHPLAVEDLLHKRSLQGRSKADYYTKHLFIRILRHYLAPEGVDGGPLDSVAPTYTEFRSSSPDGMGDADQSDDEKTEYESVSGLKFSTSKGSRRKSTGLLGRKASAAMKAQDLERGRTVEKQQTRVPTRASVRQHREVAAKTMTIEQLKKGRVNVQTKPMFMFLYRDGTVISIQATPDLDFTAPITARLRQRDTGLRTTADPSLLLQSLMDLVVDQALEVVDEYQNQILKLEHDVLLRPKMKTVRSLHILSGDLTLHKRTLEPIKTLVYGLRRYDVDRCAALLDSAQAKAAVEGFMSHKSKIYLADVHDHIDYILTSMDMFSNIAENLINYTFNMASYEMNEVMRRLTLATIIFLPLTLLTGYFGMNFDNMWSIMHGHSDIVFWIIALPLMAIVIPVFLWSDLERMTHYIQKKTIAHRIMETVKKNQ